MSLRALARQLEISDSHLSRVLRQTDYKRASPDLTSRVAVVFGLPADYFPEFREAFVIEKISSDPQLREQLYKRLTRRA